MAIYEIGGNATVTTIVSGIYQGTGNVTTTNRIEGGSFGSNITIKSVPTNTSATRHRGNYSDTRIEFTNSGIVEFDDEASGAIVGTIGPTSTIESPAYHSTQSVWEDSSTAGRFLLLRFGGSTIAGGTGSTPYSGTREDNNNPYYTASGHAWETRENGDVFYERGANQSGDNYAIIKHTCKVVVIRLGGVSMSVIDDNGSNFTDNILFSETPIDLTITGDSDTYFRVKYGTTTSTLQNGTFSLDASQVDRGDEIKVGAVKTTGDLAPVWTTFNVTNADTDGGDSQAVNITPTVPEPVPVVETEDLTENSYSFDTTNHWLIMDFAKIPQTVNANLVMNKFMTTAMKSVSNVAATVDAIMYFEDASWYRSGGVDAGQFIDPLKVKVTSSDSNGALTAQLYPNYVSLGSSTNIQDLASEDNFLTVVPFSSGSTNEGAANATAARLKPVLDGQSRGIEDGSLNIPADDIPDV